MKRTLLLFILALAARVSYLGVALRDPTYSTPVIDSETYVDDALRLLEGRGFKDAPFWQGPLYPVFLALPFSMASGSIAVAGFFQSILGALGCLLTYSLAEKLLPRNYALATGVLQALYPLSVFFDLEILAAVLQGPLLVGGVHLLLARQQRGQLKAWRPFASGLLMGFSSLAVPSSLVPGALLVIWCLLSPGSVGSPRSWSKGAKNAALFLLGLFLTLFPVSLRNRIHGHEWCLISSNGGINFYIGNNEHSLLHQSIRPGIEWQILMRAPLSEGLTSPMEKNSFFYRKALQWWREHPMDATKWTLTKLFLSLHSREILRNRNFYETAKKVPWLQLPPRPFAFLFALAFMGAWSGVKRRNLHVGLCAAMASSVLFVGILFFPTARYRAGSLPFSFILAAFGVKEFISITSRKNWCEAILWGLACLSLLLFSLLSHPFPSNQSLNRSLYNEAYVLTVRKQYLKASELFRRCIEQGIGGVDAWNELAVCEAAIGNREEAERLWRLVTRLEPGAFEAYYNLGLSLQERGKYKAALKSYTSARALDPTMPTLLLRMAFCAEKLGYKQNAERLLSEAAAISQRPTPKSLHTPSGLR